MPSSRPQLAVVPLHLRAPSDLEALLGCVVSLKATAPDLAILLVEEASPEQALVDQLESVVEELDCELVRSTEPVGHAATLNVGLRGALDYGFDAVLVDPSLELRQAGWLEQLLARTDGQGRPAAVVGARLLDRRGLLWHAGLFFSLLRHEWFERFQCGPADLPASLAPCACPVSSVLQLVRHETLQEIGLYDPTYGRFADVDFCLRAFGAGLESVYEPAVRGYLSAEPAVGRAERANAATRFVDNASLWNRWGQTDLARWIPDPL